MNCNANENAPLRRRAAGPRTNRRAVTFTDDELADITAAAVRAGMAVAAWIGRTALAAARSQEMPASDAVRELLHAVITAGTEARKQGVNLNQAVAQLHTVGASPAVEQQLLRAAAVAEEVLKEVHAAIRQVRERM